MADISGRTRRTGVMPTAADEAAWRADLSARECMGAGLIDDGDVRIVVETPEERAKAELDARNKAIREATGRVDDPRPLVGFLYDLMRDRVPVGEVLTLVVGSEKIGDKNVGEFTNGHLARAAQMYADMLGVRTGIVGPERDARFQAIDRIFAAAASLCGMPSPQPGVFSTNLLVTLADRLEANVAVCTPTPDLRLMATASVSRSCGRCATHSPAVGAQGPQGPCDGPQSPDPGPQGPQD